MQPWWFLRLLDAAEYLAAYIHEAPVCSSEDRWANLAAICSRFVFVVGGLVNPDRAFLNITKLAVSLWVRAAE